MEAPGEINIFTPSSKWASFQPARSGLGTGLTLGRAVAPSVDPQTTAPGELSAGELDVSGDLWVNCNAEPIARPGHE